MLRRIAQLKFGLMRVNPYVQLGNTVLLVFLAGWHWWYVLAVAGIALAYLFEKHWGVRGEMDMTWRNSDEWQQHKKEWDDLRSKVDRLVDDNHSRGECIVGVERREP